MRFFVKQILHLFLLNPLITHSLHSKSIYHSLLFEHLLKLSLQVLLYLRMLLSLNRDIRGDEIPFSILSV